MFFSSIYMPPPSIGQPFNFHVPFPSFVAVLNAFPLLEDSVINRSLEPFTQFLNISATWLPFTATLGLQHSQTWPSGDSYTSLFFDHFPAFAFRSAKNILLCLYFRVSSHTA